MKHVKKGDTVLVHLTAKWYSFQTFNSFRATVAHMPCDVGDCFHLNHVPSERPVILNPASQGFVGMELCDDDPQPQEEPDAPESR